ncbi:MAG TPA: GyrI-like domain-containing protein [Bacillota bacterium]|nr:GyrI-like domain-containing protein [Bacillota bacterium]
MQNDSILRINQAINYIYYNLDKSLTVEEIAAHCSFSKYYFNRVFRAVVNTSIYAFIKRVRLESAAFRLRTDQRKSITDIALEIGYTPSNFAVAFKDYFGISASEFRKQHTPLNDSYRFVIEYINDLKKRDDCFDAINSKITIKRLPAMNLEYERYIGNYRKGLVNAWDKFCMEMERKYTLVQPTRMVGISYDDPLISDDDRCVYDMCLQVNKITGINVHKIDAGLYACYEFHDQLDKLVTAFSEIFALWMPYTNYNLDHRLCLELYQSGLDASGNIHLEICIPILS